MWKYPAAKVIANIKMTQFSQKPQMPSIISTTDQNQATTNSSYGVWLGYKMGASHYDDGICLGQELGKLLCDSGIWLDSKAGICTMTVEFDEVMVRKTALWQ